MAMTIAAVIDLNMAGYPFAIEVGCPMASDTILDGHAREYLAKSAQSRQSAGGGVSHFGCEQQPAIGLGCATNGEPVFVPNCPKCVPLPTC